MFRKILAALLLVAALASAATAVPALAETVARCDGGNPGCN